MRNPVPDDTKALQIRQDLVVALRSAARYGLNEGICNHFSAVLPDHPGVMAINAEGVYWPHAKVSDIVLVSIDAPLTASDTVELSALQIHAAAHRAAPKAICVLHTHMPYATTLTLLKEGRLQMAHQTACRFYGRVAYDDIYNGPAFSTEEGERLAEFLRAADIVMLGSHGVIVTADSVAYALDELYYLERACMLQVLAHSTGQPLKTISNEIAVSTALAVKANMRQRLLHFHTLTEVAKREDPEAFAL